MTHSDGGDYTYKPVLPGKTVRFTPASAPVVLPVPLTGPELVNQRLLEIEQRLAEVRAAVTQMTTIVDAWRGEL